MTSNNDQSGFNKKLIGLMADPLTAVVLESFQKNVGRIPTEEDLDLLIDMQRKGPVKLHRPQQWIDDLN